MRRSWLRGVTNAVLHPGGPLTVEVFHKGSAYRIAVSDGSSTPPAEKGYRRDDATGRGVQLLERLAAAWGCKRTGTGKVVWFDVPVPLMIHRRAAPSGRRGSVSVGILIALLGAPIQADDPHRCALRRSLS